MKNGRKKRLVTALTLAGVAALIGAVHAADSVQTAADCYTYSIGKKFEMSTSTEPSSYTTAAGEKRSYPSTVTTLEIEAAPELAEGSFFVKSSDAGATRSQLYQLSDTILERLMLVHEYPKGGGATFAHSDWQRSRTLKVGGTETLAFSVVMLGRDTAPDETKLRYAFEAIEDLKTPAGTFKQACRFKVLSAEVTLGSGKPPVAVMESGITHWAPGYGVVRSVTSVRYSDGRQPAVVVSSSVATRLLK
jgi:hypothetical protein